MAMATFVLLKDDEIPIDQRWFATGQFPDQPNAVKQMKWYILQEVWPTPAETEKIEGFTFSVDHESGIATKTYTVVSKSAEELTAMAAWMQRAKDLKETLAAVEKAESMDVKELADITGLIKSMAKGMYWLIKDQKG
jgi:hypothetical protein